MSEHSSGPVISCKVGTLEDINERFDHMTDASDRKETWRVWKERTIRFFLEGKRRQYILQADGRNIGEAFAALTPDACSNSDRLVGPHTAYLFAFRVDEGLREHGYFTRLFEFMLDDLRSLGITRVTVGVEPRELRNKQIYRHYGFTQFVKTSFEEDPPNAPGEMPYRYLVEYYAKDL